MTEQKVREQIAYLYSTDSVRESKYIRNLNRYMNNGIRREDIWNPKVFPQGYNKQADGTDGVQTQINVIKSCIDTVASKISQANVRPFFDPENGDYKTTKTVRQLQQFTDIWLDEQHAYPKSVMCFRDASLFDIGVMKIDAESQSIQRIAPWEYFVDPAEYGAGSISRAMHYRKYYPLISLHKKIDNKDLKKRLDENPYQTGEYAIFYDLYGGYRYDFYGKDQICEPEKLDYEQYGGLYRRPFVEIFYTRPLKGMFSVSLCDDLYPLQRQIDEIVKRLDQAFRQSVINMLLVPKGSGLKASNIENGVRAYDWHPGPEGGKPEFFTPQPANGQFLDGLKMYIDQAYQTAGISQLSAQGQKPSGLDSGAALRTMEDIESDRFNVQLQQFTHFLVDVCRVSIDCFPSGLKMLPDKKGRANVTWGEVRNQRNAFSISFSAASSLSKDPSAKMDEINKMMTMGFINREQASALLELPDIKGAYSLAGSSIDYVHKIIDDAITNEDYDYEETVNLQLLANEIISSINRYESAEDYESVERLKELLRVTYDTMRNVDEVKAQTEQPQPMPQTQEVPTQGGVQ